MLDASTRIDVLNLLGELKERGLGILFVTHDLSLGNYISDTTVILRRGRDRRDGRDASRSSATRSTRTRGCCSRRCRSCTGKWDGRIHSSPNALDAGAAVPLVEVETGTSSRCRSERVRPGGRPDERSASRATSSGARRPRRTRSRARSTETAGASRSGTRFCRRPGKVDDGDNGDVACDHYHRYPDDIRLMRELGLDAYRFSIAWPRVLPGRPRPVKPPGLDFYDRLVDACWRPASRRSSTLYHWDLPQALEDAGGWPAGTPPSAFAEYAERRRRAARRPRRRTGSPINEPQVLGLHRLRERRCTRPGERLRRGRTRPRTTCCSRTGWRSRRCGARRGP